MNHIKSYWIILNHRFWQRSSTCIPLAFFGKQSLVPGFCWICVDRSNLPPYSCAPWKKVGKLCHLAVPATVPLAIFVSEGGQCPWWRDQTKSKQCTNMHNTDNAAQNQSQSDFVVTISAVPPLQRTSAPCDRHTWHARAETKYCEKENSVDLPIQLFNSNLRCSVPEKIWEESIVEGCCTLFALPGLSTAWQFSPATWLMTAHNYWQEDFHGIHRNFWHGSERDVFQPFFRKSTLSTTRSFIRGLPQFELSAKYRGTCSLGGFRGFL